MRPSVTDMLRLLDLSDGVDVYGEWVDAAGKALPMMFLILSQA